MQKIYDRQRNNQYNFFRFTLFVPFAYIKQCGQFILTPKHNIDIDLPKSIS